MNRRTKSVRKERIERQKRQQQARSIGMIIIGVIIVLGVVVGLSYAGDIAVNLIEPPLRQHPQAEMNTLGDPNAPVVVENYSSFACLHCKNFFDQSEEKFIQNFVKTGLVYYVYKPYHFDKSRLETQASHAAMCAGEQGYFWKMHDMLFANFTNAYSKTNLDDMADYFGLDMDAFDACMASEKYYDPMIEESRAAVTELEITGTPTFVINGSVAIVGNEGYEALAQAVNAALAAVDSE